MVRSTPLCRVISGMFTTEDIHTHMYNDYCIANHRSTTSGTRVRNLLVSRSNLKILHIQLLHGDDGRACQISQEESGRCDI